MRTILEQLKLLDETTHNYQGSYAEFRDCLNTAVAMETGGVVRAVKSKIAMAKIARTDSLSCLYWSEESIYAVY